MRSSNPPAGFLAPDHQLEAVQEVGLPEVVQVSLVEFEGSVIEVGLAEMETEMGVGGVTFTQA